MFDQLVTSVRFPTLLMPPVDDQVLDGLALQMERLANAATVLAARPTPYIARAQVLITAAERARTVSRMLPELTERERRHWARAEAAVVMETIELCRDDVCFPRTLDELIFDVRAQLTDLVVAPFAA